MGEQRGLKVDWGACGSDGFALELSDVGCGPKGLRTRA